MSTPHISANVGDIAPRVLMPGDPYRAARIASEFLTDARIVSDVRGIQCHTGTWEGHAVSVMASGMGIPTMSLYSTELYRYYGVERIIRVGTCGAISERVAVRDLIVGTAAHTNSSVATFPGGGVNLSLAPSYTLLHGAAEAADAAGVPVHMGPIYSSDYFYIQRNDVDRALADLGTLGVDMEAAGLYYTAMREQKQALAILTASDHLKDPSANMTTEERETGYRAMTVVALKAITI